MVELKGKKLQKKQKKNVRKAKKVRTPGEKGIRVLKHLLLRMRLQRAVSKILMLAGLAIICAGILYGGYTGYQAVAYTGSARGTVTELKEPSESVTKIIDAFQAGARKGYPVVSFEGRTGNVICEGTCLLEQKESGQMELEVRFLPENEQRSMLTIDIMDRLIKCGLLFLIGILIFFNAKVLLVARIEQIQGE